MSDKAYYPVFLDLADRSCLVVGGGKVAERKCSALIEAGARLTVVSPEITRRLALLKKKGLIRHVQRNYRRTDIKPAFIVIAATDSEDTNRRIAQDALAGNKLLNVVDTPGLCSFIVPSVLRRGLLTIAISTGGASPAMAKAIRKRLGKLFGPEYSRHLKLMKDSRARAMRGISSRKERETFLKSLAESILEKGY